jgi:hypothetical protein
MAKNNATDPDPGGTPALTRENAPQHHLMAEGKAPPLSPSPKTKW